MNSHKNNLFYTILLTNILNYSCLSVKLSTEFGLHGSKSDSVKKHQNSGFINSEAPISLKQEFGDALFPVRLMVTLNKRSVSFLELGSTLKETVESGPVSRFEHLSNVGSYMIEMAESCSKHELTALIKEIEVLGGLVEFDVLAHPASQLVTRINSPRPDPKPERSGLKYDKNQWHISEMNVDDGWSEQHSSNARHVKVCVVDSGIDYTNKAFSGRLATEKRKTAPEKASDPNTPTNQHPNLNKPGHDDVLVSANFVDENFDPMDTIGYGTHTSGIIASNYRSSKVAGINPFAKIVACKAFDSLDRIRLTNVVRCIDFCLLSGAEIQSHAWVVGKKLKFLKRAFSSAHRAGVIMVVPAGNLDSPVSTSAPPAKSNSCRNVDLATQLPASYSRKFPNVVSTANLMLLDKAASKQLLLDCMRTSRQFCHNRDTLALNANSMYGAGSVQLAAPGTNIYSLFSQNCHALVTGTSAAAAMVAGVLSFILSIFPSPSSHYELRANYLRAIQILRESVRPVPGLDGRVGWKGLPDCKSGVELAVRFLKGAKRFSTRPRSRRRKLTI